MLLCGGGIWLALPGQHAAALKRQQQAALQTAQLQQQQTLLLDYTNSISDMLADDDLLHAKPTDPARILANARTQETLRQLDPASKATLMLFLYDTKLLDDDYHIISLKGADLRGVHLANLDINDIALDGADLSGADLHGTDLHGANIDNANLAGADLTGAVGTSTAQLLKAHSLAGTKLPNGSALPGQENDTD